MSCFPDVVYKTCEGLPVTIHSCCGNVAVSCHNDGGKVCGHVVDMAKEKLEGHHLKILCKMVCFPFLY